MSNPFLATARAIGDRLVSTAVWDLERCNWTGDEMDNATGTWQIVHRPVDGGLYSGSAGIARFLAHLWRASGGELYRTTALGAVRRAFETAERSPSIAFWSGSSGIACAALDIGHVLRDPSVSSEGVSLARRIAARDVPRLLAQGACALDLISGVSGTLVGLVYLARRCGDAMLRQACEAMATRLLTAARREPAGWSWPMREGDDAGPHLCGMAHGASGVALALMEAHALWAAPAFADAAWRAMEYENCWFDRDQSNWPDLRAMGEPGASRTADSARRGYSCFWCHGAAGIGLARLRLYQVTSDLRALADAGAALHTIDRALHAMLVRGDMSPIGSDQWNFSVCHGAGSLIEVLLYAYRLFGRAEYMRAARAVAWAGIREVAAAHGVWRCGVPGGEEHPGAMLGLAGIGMEYLALADPRVPPVTMWV